MMKCPVCGYDPNKHYNYITVIKNIYEKKSKRTSSLIKKVWNEVIKNTPSERNQRNLFLFMMAIKEIDDAVINKAIEIFLSGRYHERQYGMSYLKYMILNWDKNKEARAKSERKRLGTPPPERKPV